MTGTKEGGEPRVKFRTIFESRDAIRASAKSRELLTWCKRFHKNGLVPVAEDGKSLGNLSYRTRSGFVITASGISSKERLTAHWLTQVVGCNERTWTVRAIGRHVPSSDTFLHWIIYQTRPDVEAVFHGHNQDVLRRAAELHLLVTGRATLFGTRADLYEMKRHIKPRINFLVRRGHGFIALGSNMREAGAHALSVYRKVK